MCTVCLVKRAFNFQKDSQIWAANFLTLRVWKVVYVEAIWNDHNLVPIML